METFTIEKGIPITHSRYPFEQMETGDSFLITDISMYKNIHSARTSVITTAARSKVKVKTRSTDKGLRVWRIA